MDILSLVRLAKSKGASDLHLVANNPPMMRVNGSLESSEDLPVVTPEEMDRALEQITSEKQRNEFNQKMELDFGYTIPNVVRVRCNAARERGACSLVLRLLPQVIPSIEGLKLPSICRDFVLKPRGLVIVSGPTGSGKSTTLAAMIDYLNENDNCRVVTIEDPIEHIYRNRKCTITQRELGTDTSSFAEALRHVLRQDPDVILVGEMRDQETAAAALNIAETGHLVLTTGHASSAYQAIERVIDLFPVHERSLAQTRLASLLIGILCQALVPTIDGKGRIPAVEIMLANTAVRNLIREGKIYQLPNVMRTHSREGMQMLDQALVSLYQNASISRDNVFGFCNDREEVERLIGPSGNQVTNRVRPTVGLTA